MNDLISRQAAIDALCRRCDLAAEDDEPCTEKCNDIRILEKLPSAQPEKRTDKRTETHACDLISRQAAISTAKTMYERCDTGDIIDYRDMMVESLEVLPSAEKPFKLPEIYVADGYDTVAGEDGNVGFGVYVPDENQIYVAGDVEDEIRARALFHEIGHWVQAMCGRPFDEDEANRFAEVVYDALPSAQPTQSNTPNALTALDCISRQAAIDALHMHLMYRMGTDNNKKRLDDWINSLPSAQPKERTEERAETHACDLIDRQAAIRAVNTALFPKINTAKDAEKALRDLPSAESEQRYTEEELRVFAHGISLSLLSKRSAQHWQYDEDTATEIEFLERLYEKVRADMRGGQDENR